jgi:hypothetical protein
MTLQQNQFMLAFNTTILAEWVRGILPIIGVVFCGTTIKWFASAPFILFARSQCGYNGREMWTYEYIKND